MPNSYSQSTQYSSASQQSSQTSSPADFRRQREQAILQSQYERAQATVRAQQVNASKKKFSKWKIKENMHQLQLLQALYFQTQIQTQAHGMSAPRDRAEFQKNMQQYASTGAVSNLSNFDQMKRQNHSLPLSVRAQPFSIPPPILLSFSANGVPPSNFYPARTDQQTSQRMFGSLQRSETRSWIPHLQGKINRKHTTKYSSLIISFRLTRYAQNFKDMFCRTSRATFRSCQALPTKMQCFSSLLRFKTAEKPVSRMLTIAMVRYFLDHYF